MSTSTREGRFRPIRPARITAVIVLVAALAALALGAAAPPAAAKTSCARQIIEQWVDVHRIDSTYPLHCYREAIAAVPEDLRVYTGIVDDILRARQQASRSNSRILAGANSSGVKSAKKQAAKDPSPALFKQAFDKLGSRNADTVPLPLLILAGLSLLLIAAGAAGLVARRLRARKVPG
jgi:hypothetical protein